MKRQYIVLILFLLAAVSICAQQKMPDRNFYYYKGEKFYIYTDYSRISIATEGSISADKMSNTIKEMPVKIMNSGKIYKEQNFIKEKEKSFGRNVDVFVTEIEFPTKQRENVYFDMIQSIKDDENVVQVTPSFQVNGQRMGLSNNFYVKLLKTEDKKRLYDMADAYSIQILGSNGFMPLWFTLACTKESPCNSIEAANLFHESQLFECAEPEFLYHDLPMFVPSDTYYGYQWGLKNTGQYGGTSGVDIKAEQAWNITKGNSNVKVAVIDGGFQLNHPDLNVYGTGYDASPFPPDSLDASFLSYPPSSIKSEHGTACAGIIAAKHNSTGVSGIAPECLLMSISLDMDCVRVVDTGTTFGDTPARVANAFNWAWMNGASVISCSWGSHSPATYIDEAISNALNNGRNGLGCIVVFAAGNQNTTINYPANSNPNLILVGAISQCGTRKRSSSDSTDCGPGVLPDPLGVSCDTELAWGSNYGLPLDIMAPGVLIASTDLQAGVSGSGYNRDTIPKYNIQHVSYLGSLLTNYDDFTDRDYERTFGGTSAACPHVSGVAALVLSVNPTLTRLQVTDIIEQTAQKIGGYSYQNTAGRLNGKWHQEMGYGLLNAYAAVNRASPTTTTAISNQQYNTSTNITACNVVLENVSVIYNGTVKLTIDDLQGTTTINGPFEVALNAQLEIK